MRRLQGKKGFTLIELLIVIAIIGILAAVLIPNLLRARQVAVDRAGQAFVQNVYTAAQAYLAENVTATSVNTSCSSAGYYPGAAEADGYVVAPWGQLDTCTVASDGGAVSAYWTGGTGKFDTAAEAYGLP